MRVGVISWWYYLKFRIRSWNRCTTSPSFRRWSKEIEADMAAQLARVREMETQRGVGIRSPNWRRISRCH